MTEQSAPSPIPQPYTDERESSAGCTTAVGRYCWGGAFVLLIAMGATASAQAVPDPKLTPGAVASTDLAAICAPGYARSHRLYEIAREAYWSLTDHVLRTYGVHDRHAVELDHRVPLALGGANSWLNVWPQPLAEARIKDRLEIAVWRAVCRDHTLSLDAAQAMFMGDWRRAYRERFGTAP